MAAVSGWRLRLEHRSQLHASSVLLNKLSFVERFKRNRVSRGVFTAALHSAAGRESHW